MRDLTLLDEWRRSDLEEALYGARGDAGNGVFHLPHPATGVTLRCIASNGGGWDHVSVSLLNRCPNWPEMAHIARMFFCDDEYSMQLHVPPTQHINRHPYTLHIWRPQLQNIPTPPQVFV